LPRPDLDDQARQFADDLSDLLNRTVTNGIRLSAVVTPNGTTLVGRGLTPRNFTSETVPLCKGRNPPRIWLRVAFVLELDDERRYLTVTKSDYSVCLDEAGASVLAHYDYAREPDNEYPAAHVQVNGSNPDLVELYERLCAPVRELGHLHFPVGGRRFRPTLEDLIEFLVLEELVEGHAGWQEVIATHRGGWERLQLRAAVRRDPDTALAQLRDMDLLQPADPHRPKKKKR
jgi:hypothetical protein